MEAAQERDSTQDWLVPASAAPPLLGELELKVDEALAIARASEAGVAAVGEAALDAARQARRAAELAETASAAAVAAASAAGPVTAGDPPSPAVAKASSGMVPPTVPPAAEATGDTAEFTVSGGRTDVDVALRRFTERADRVAARFRAV